MKYQVHIRLYLFEMGDRLFGGGNPALALTGQFPSTANKLKQLEELSTNP